jgi:predicted lipoprotein with Yx(FWY)xxD motif
MNKPTMLVGRWAALGLAVTLAAAACTAGAPVASETAAPTVSGTPLILSAPPISPAPSSVAAPSPTDKAAGGGGRYGTGGGSKATPAPGLVIKAASTSLGSVLTGVGGLSLYIHAGDTPNDSTCTGGCASAWPPVLIKAGAKVTAGSGVTGTLGTFTRTDGTTQVTYNGKPLYSWPGDSAPGDTTGQGMGGFSVAKA